MQHGNIAIINRANLIQAMKSGHLKLFIEQALREPTTTDILAEVLLKKNEEGKNVLHEACFLNPPNPEVITLLCETASNLHAQGYKNLAEYVNSTDSEHGNTALHFTVKQSQFANYVALRTANASINNKSNNGIKPIEMLRYRVNEDNAALFLKLYITTTAEGADYFQQHCGCQLSVLTDGKLLDALIKIDLNTKLLDNPQAQIDAYLETLRLQPTCHYPDVTAVMSNISHINFAIIAKYGQNILAKQTSGPAEILRTAIIKASCIADDKMKNAFICAEILSQYISIKELNTKAFVLYSDSELMRQQPQLALDGIKKLKTSLLPINVLARSLVIAIAQLELQKERANKQDNDQKSGWGFFAPKTTEQIIENLLVDFAKATSIDNIVASIQKLKIQSLQNKLFTELEDKKLIPSQQQKRQP